MKKRLIALLLVVVMLCTLLPVGAFAGQTVYITDTGNKYHSYGCKYLSESSTAVQLDYALKQGYTPCSVCNAQTYDAGFVDVASGSYCYDAVQWAVAKGITKGTDTTHFSPNTGCTRAQVVTFLWRAAGEPSVSAKVSFVDVSKSSVYYDAIMWAVANGITKGTDATHFAPSATCTRGQVVTFMYRAAGEHKVSGTAGSFVDVAYGSYCYDAVLWAVANGITKGTDATHFSPSATCTRGQVVTFLYRYYNSNTPDPDPTPDPAPTPDPTPTPDPSPAPTPEPSEDIDYIVSGKLPYPCPTPESGVPSPTDAATHDNALALLDTYCPNGAYILRATEADGSNFMVWLQDDTLLNRIETAVHEQSHAYTSYNSSYNMKKDPATGEYSIAIERAYYLGEGSHIMVPETATYKTEEIASIVPESLRSFRYDTYVGAGATVDSNVNGIYGLMNEFTAYSWGSLAGISLYEYFLDQPLTAENWLEYVSIASSSYFAYSEFKFFILSYMLYAKENYPEIYEQTMNNQALLDAFRIVEIRYRATVEQYFANLDSLEEYLEANGLDTKRENGYFYISTGGGGYSGRGTSEETYTLLENAMQAPEYVEMYNLMTK